MKDKPFSFYGGNSNIMCCLQDKDCTHAKLQRGYLQCNIWAFFAAVLRDRQVSLHALLVWHSSLWEQIWPKTPAELFISRSGDSEKLRAVCTDCTMQNLLLGMQQQQSFIWMHALPVPLVFFICILKCSHIYCTVRVAVQEKYNACTSSATCFFYMHS